MTELFKLYPQDPTSDSKLVVLKDRNDREPVPLNILGWRRILPNKIAVPVQSAQVGAYQCTALDSNCIIEVTISYKIFDKIINKALISNPITLSKQLTQRALYVIQPTTCRLSIDEYTIFIKIMVENKKLSFISEIGRFQTPIFENLIQVQPFRLISLLNITSFRNQFLRFYSDSLKRVAKFRSNHCFCVFNSKLQQDLFLYSFVDSFKQSTIANTQIKLIGGITTTPKHDKDKQLRNDGSASSLTSNNKSKTKNKQKVKISERLNLKKSCTKLTPHSSSKITGTNTNNTTRCLNIFEQDNNQEFTKGTQSSLANPCDMSMDLRGSFEQLQKTNNKDDDNLSNSSFKQKQPPRQKLGPIDEENRRLRQQNAKLKKQIQSMSETVKQANNLKKKYSNAVQQINRLEGQRIAIVKDKMKFQSAYYEQLQQKQKLKKQLDALKLLMNGQKNFKA